MSRAAGPDVRWVCADIDRGTGLSAAVAGVRTVIHCASSPYQRTREVDVEGTRRLVETCSLNGVAHFVFVSITGVDRMPFPYYRAKLDAEKIVESSGVPFTIVRITQFFPFVDWMLRRLLALPVGLLPAGGLLQPIDMGEAADRVVDVSFAAPAGRIAESGGPQVMSFGDIARQWKQARGRSVFTIPVPAVGASLKALHQGALTCPNGWRGRKTWLEWLK